MGEIVLPLLSESGYVSADESTGNLLLIDTVENLIHIEAIIAQFDVPGGGADDDAGLRHRSTRTRRKWSSCCGCC